MFGTNTYHLAKEIAVQVGRIVSLAFAFKMDLGEGLYHLTVALHTGGSHRQTCYHWKERACDFTVSGFKREFFVGIAGLYPALSYEPVKLSESLPLDVAAKVALEVMEAPMEIPCGTRFSVGVNVMNNSGRDLASHPPNPVHLSYHWLRVDDRTIAVFDGDRSFLLPPVPALGHGTYRLSVLSPPGPGDYLLRMTLVQEQVFWFDQVAGHHFADCRVRVK
ncbi:Wzt, C-terminal [Acididesulfobacillus acetoxydans]|uniref:Sulfotransferase n=1 Tax=Acididesulfobacillus acetoxydans TaxID=1561005 RepID=A0A8S0WDU6_9FIRM|nr:Wzt, C-terminal [Acididesulfobacillus acetoxydans]CEJ07757.1 Sulfotransferase [Acididesulfobacillus acetoxydans]